MNIETDLRTSVYQRARQFALKIREVKSISAQIVNHIDGIPEPLTGWIAYSFQQSLTKQRNDIINWPFGSLTDANVRAEVARQWPLGFDPSDPTRGYANAAAVQTKIAAVNSSFILLQTELDDLVIAEVDTQPDLNSALIVILSSPETDPLRAQAVIVRDSINGPVAG